MLSEPKGEEHRGPGKGDAADRDSSPVEIVHGGAQPRGQKVSTEDLAIEIDPFFGMVMIKQHAEAA